MEALPRAVEIWNQPDAMITEWEADEHKHRHEQLVAEWVGTADDIADLGCGVGRYARILTFTKYYGFDSSVAMVHNAQLNYGYVIGAEFSTVDIFNFSNGVYYDVAIMIDVAHHQKDPVDSIIRMASLWDARRRIVSLLVGDVREDLYASTVVPFSELLRLLDHVSLMRSYIDHCGPEPFAWVLLEFK